MFTKSRNIFALFDLMLYIHQYRMNSTRNLCREFSDREFFFAKSDRNMMELTWMFSIADNHNISTKEACAQ